MSNFNLSAEDLRAERIGGLCFRCTKIPACRFISLELTMGSFICTICQLCAEQVEKGKVSYFRLYPDEDFDETLKEWKVQGILNE